MAMRKEGGKEKEKEKFSLSGTDLKIVEFLTRNFEKHLTMRNISQMLGLSSAGVFSSLKRLEKNSIVTSARLGTGLFYHLNFENKRAMHLAAFTLLTQEEQPLKEEKLKEYGAKCAFVKTSNGKDNIITVAPHSPDKSSTATTDFISEEEFFKGLKERKGKPIEILRKGRILFGETFLINIISRVAPRL